MEGDRSPVVLAGNICETGDVLTHTTEGISEQWLPALHLGNRVAILDTGAYGMAMSSQYNMRPRPAEVLVNEGRSALIRKRETYEDLTRSFIT